MVLVSFKWISYLFKRLIRKNWVKRERKFKSVMAQLGLGTESGSAWVILDWLSGSGFTWENMLEQQEQMHSQVLSTYIFWNYATSLYRIQICIDWALRDSDHVVLSFFLHWFSFPRKKNLDSYYSVTLFDFLSLKNYIPSKSNKQKKFLKN